MTNKNHYPRELYKTMTTGKLQAELEAEQYTDLTTVHLDPHSKYAVA